METSASNLTKGSPVQIPPAPALTNAKTLDTLQPTQERTTLTPRDLDPSQRLAFKPFVPRLLMNTSLICPLPPQLTSLNLPFTCMITLTVHLLMLSLLNLLASPRIGANILGRLWYVFKNSARYIFFSTNSYAFSFRMSCMYMARNYNYPTAVFFFCV